MSTPLARTRREAEGCRDCPLWRDATQTVFGEGPARAATLVGASRGRPLESAMFAPVLVTAHPSSVPRERDADVRHTALEALVADLRVASRLSR